MKKERLEIEEKRQELGNTTQKFKLEMKEIAKVCFEPTQLQSLDGKRHSVNRHTIVDSENKPGQASQMALSEIESELSKLMGTLKRGPAKKRHTTNWIDSHQQHPEMVKSVEPTSGIKSFGYEPVLRTDSVGGKRVWEMSQARHRAKLEDHNAWLDDFRHRTLALTR